MSSTNNRELAAINRVKTIAELADISKEAKQAGKRVVLAHGAFDLLHLGHARHLEAARAMGDLLIVTVTGDEFISKGPGRPVFPERLRAEMLATLECVDWSGVNYARSAEEMIREIKPSVYVKGQDYSDAQADVTGKIVAEREAVESGGGSIAFTDDVVFSSSELVNEHFITRDQAAQDFIQRLKTEPRRQQILDLIDKARESSVVLVGETIIDEYVYVYHLGRTGKSHNISTHYADSELFAGGVIAAANHVASMVDHVTVVTAIGDDGFESFVRASLSPNVTLELIHLSDRPTIKKRRYLKKPTSPLEQLHKLFEVQTLDSSPLSAEQTELLNDRIRTHTRENDITIVCDFGHGLIGEKTVLLIEESARFLAVNAQANSANMGFNLITKYHSADYMCVDEPEARLAACDARSEIAEAIFGKIMSRLKTQRFVVTMGSKGSTCVNADGSFVNAPGFAYDPIDTIGAGDAFLAVTAPLFHAGGNPEDVTFIGNVVGGMKVSMIGHRAGIDRGGLITAIKSLLK